ncbi:MAG: hypothetical protein ACLFPX_03385 [Candidatus Omnitrophota bacterium]
MTRDEIYDHLARVYLGKKNQSGTAKDKKQFSAWLVINIVITVVIFASAFYGFTAFLTRRSDTLRERVIYSLNHGPIRVRYNIGHPYPQVKTFVLPVGDIDGGRYGQLEFRARGGEYGNPGIVRIEVRNARRETASVMVSGISERWGKQQIPFAEFEGLTDWSQIREIKFILESWNAEKDRGELLIDDVCFSNALSG